MRIIIDTAQSVQDTRCLSQLTAVMGEPPPAVAVRSGGLDNRHRSPRPGAGGAMQRISKGGGHHSREVSLAVDS